MRQALIPFIAFLLTLPAAAQVTLPTRVISASRAPSAPAEIPFSVTVLSGDTLRATPTATLDDALRSVPGFSLFRRSGSLSANPTAQGVSLRGLGPSGASRSLVLLDGVPLNDPFGGWVAWTKVPRETLASVEIVRGGGATAWGNAALGGIVQLLTTVPATERGRFAASLGDFSLRSAELSLSQTIARGTLQISGNDFSTDGFLLVAPEDRGPIDLAAASRHHWLSARWSQPVGPTSTLTVSARTFAEHRGNGTPYQRNSSRENFGSITFTDQASRNFSWAAIAYAQDQSFASSFGSVNATRTSETPASNQYAVPATAGGASLTGVWLGENKSRTSAGFDYRQVRGETREYFTYTNGDFTRERIAGGTQDITGIFLMHEHPLADHWRGTLGARLDFWHERDGHRRETTRATAAILRDDHYANADGTEFSPSAGLVWQPTPAWRLRAAAQQSFRRPTLNELYRPFRVGNVITEANANLKTERATSTELSAEYTHESLALSATVFRNDLRDAVANVTLARGPGTFPIVGFVPAGGLGRQRLNLERLLVQGVELSAKWQLSPAFSLSADYLYNDATVRRASLAPALVGNRLAQVPRHSASLGASWQPTKKLTLTPRLRGLGRQCEDDENLLRLGAALVLDLGASYRVTPNCEIFLTGENLTDARVETGRSADGIVNTGTPRLILGGVRCAW
jgi:outer membrane receptor protein involved in Fe transport